MEYRWRESKRVSGENTTQPYAFCMDKELILDPQEWEKYDGK